MIGYTVVMLYMSARLTAALFVLAPSIALIVSVVGRRYRRIRPRIQHSMGEVTGTIDEVVSGQREVKIYGGQAYERARFNAGRQRESPAQPQGRRDERAVDFVRAIVAAFASRR